MWKLCIDNFPKEICKYTIELMWRKLTSLADVNKCKQMIYGTVVIYIYLYVLIIYSTRGNIQTDVNV